MKSNWQTKRLGDVCEFDKAQGLWKDLPYVGLEDIESKTGRFVGSGEPQEVKSATFKFTPNHILYGRLRPYLNKVLLPDFDGHCSTEIFPIKIINGLDNRYLLHWFLWDSTVEKIDATCTGARMPRANMNEVLNFEIPVPPIEEQRRIVAILDEAFEAIDKAKQNAKKNLQNARELFESHLQSVFVQLGDSLELRKLKDFAQVLSGHAFKSVDFKKTGKYQVLRMGNVRPGTIRPNENPVFLDEVDEGILRRALLKPGDVIITQTGTKKKRDYGFTALVDGESYLLNQRLASIRFSERALPKFFLYFSWTDAFKDQFFANETGTVGQGNVGIGAVTESLVPFCDKEQQLSIVTKLDNMLAEIQGLESIYRRKLTALGELRKSFLHRAFRGDI